MASQKSMDEKQQAVAPKRKRGHDRVGAILEAASLLLHEKGYQALTMTEVASRSSTAIGSLYRFFPTKAALIGVLLDRYRILLSGALDIIVAAADQLTAPALANDLIAVLEDLRQERAAALMVLEWQENQADLRQSVRSAILERLSTLLQRAAGVTADVAEPKAIMLLQLLKGIASLEAASPVLQQQLQHEARQLVTLYLQGVGVKP